MRFPEFRANWENIELKHLAQSITERVGVSPSVPYTVTSGAGLISQKEKLGRTIAGNSLKNYIRLQKNDFAYNKSATKAFPEGYIARYVGDDKAAVPNSIFTCFRVNGQSVDPEYLDYLFANNLHGRWLRKFLTVGARAHGSLNVSEGDLMALLVPLPSGPESPDEQKKIAACLSSVDGLIAAERRRLTLLRDHKKGLMQQLFALPGETRPRLRFPEFRTAPEWEPRKVGDLLEKVARPVTIQANETYREIGVRSHGRGLFYKEPVQGSALGTKRVFQVVEDAFVLNIVFAWEQAVTFTTKAESGMIASHRFPMFTPKSDRCDVRFLKFAFLTPTGKHLLGLASPGGAGRNRTLGQDEFEKIEMLVPDRNEQTRIADAVLAATAIITAQESCLNALQSHRKGLMQQLFPFAGAF